MFADVWIHHHTSTIALELKYRKALWGSSAGIVRVQTMTDRKRLRNQIQGCLLASAWPLVSLVRNLLAERPHDTREWWIANIAFVAFACVGFGMAGTFWKEYREKFPRR